jgi:hypothetical protein
VAGKRRRPREPSQQPENGPDQQAAEEAGLPVRAEPVPLVSDLKHTVEMSGATWIVDKRLSVKSFKIRVRLTPRLGGTRG